MTTGKTIFDAIALTEEIIAGKDHHGDLSAQGIVMNAESIRDILVSISSASNHVPTTADAVINTERLVKWIDDSQRSKASAHFPDGAERQIACRFENLFDRLKTLNK